MNECVHTCCGLKSKAKSHIEKKWIFFLYVLYNKAQKQDINMVDLYINIKALLYS